MLSPITAMLHFSFVYLSAPAALRRSRAEMLAGEESDEALAEEEDESHLVVILLKKQGFLACSWINSNCDFRPGGA